MRWSHYFAQFSVCAVILMAPFAAQAASEDDPWESINRPIFTFNDTVDTYALKPLAQGYQFVTPQFVQDGVHNFFRNIGDVGNLAEQRAATQATRGRRGYCPPVDEHHLRRAGLYRRRHQNGAATQR